MLVEILLKLVADGLVLPVALIGAYALLRYVSPESRYRTYARVMMAGLTAYTTAKIIGLVYQPEAMRPFELLGVSAGATFLQNPGFPSDHALFTMAITLAVWCNTHQKHLALLCLLLTVLVGIGRIIALVHSPLDVLGGFVIAGIGIVWYMPFHRPAAVQHQRSDQ